MYLLHRFSFRAKVPKGIDLETDTKMSSDQKNKVFEILSCQKIKIILLVSGEAVWSGQLNFSIRVFSMSTNISFFWCPDKIAGTTMAADSIAADIMAGGRNSLRTK